MANFAERIRTRLDKVVDKKLKAAAIKGTRAAYLHIMNNWPVYTGFSKANNRISITGRPITNLRPARRNWREGAHLGNAMTTQNGELAKLERLRSKAVNREDKTIKIVLGNSALQTRYYDDADKLKERGKAIYKAASAQARAVGAAALKEK